MILWGIKVFLERERRERGYEEIEVFEIWGWWSGLSLECWPPSLAGEFAMITGNVFMPSEGCVGDVLELSVESWSLFVILKSRHVRSEGLWIPQELGCGAMLRGLGQCVGLCCLSWVACVPHAQPVFPSCCWPSFHDGPIVPMVAPALMGVALPEVAVVPFFSFFFCLFFMFVCNKGGGFPSFPLCRFLC